MASAAMTIVYVGVWLFMLAGWTIDLAGVGRLTALCMDRDRLRYWSVANAAGAQMPSEEERDKQCGFDYSFEWWNLALQFLVIVLALVAIFTRKLNRGIVTAITVISTVHLSDTASTYIKMWRGLSNARSLSVDEGMAVSTVCAGKIIELVFNYVWIFIFAKFVHDEAPGAEGGKPTSA